MTRDRRISEKIELDIHGIVARRTFQSSNEVQMLDHLHDLLGFFTYFRVIDPSWSRIRREIRK